MKKICLISNHFKNPAYKYHVFMFKNASENMSESFASLSKVKYFLENRLKENIMLLIL